MSQEFLSPAETTIIIASKVAREAMGRSNNHYYRGLPVHNTYISDYSTNIMDVVDSFLYGGLYGGLTNQTSAALSFFISSNFRDKQKYIFDNSLGKWSLDSVQYIAKNLIIEGELLLSKALAAAPPITNRLTPIATNIPARKAGITKADATRGQKFQFFFRSLKPSIWKHDLDPNPMYALTSNAPKGILTMPHSISEFSERYNPTWAEQNILGSSQKLHKYKYTDRQISLTVELYSNSLIELRYNIWRLNWLADHTYGKLSNFKKQKLDIINQITNEIPSNALFSQDIEYKEFPFIKITIGTVVNELPCYISSLSINYHMDSPWEMGDDLLNRINGSKTLQWPHWITIQLTFNVLYDTMDPTQNYSFYSQDGSKETNQNFFSKIASGNLLSALDYIEWGDK